MNGISVKVLEKLDDGSLRLKIKFDDYAIRNDLRACGNIIFPPETISIHEDVKVEIDKSGTPNRHTKLDGEFVNPTEVTLQSNAHLIINDGAAVIIKNNSTLHINDGATVTIKGSGKLKTKDGGTIVNNGTIIPPDYDESNMFVQNETFNTNNQIIALKNISAGSDVTNSIPEGPVTVNDGSHLTLNSGQNFTIKNDFEVKTGAEFTVTTDNTYPNYKFYSEGHVNTDQADGNEWHTENFDDEYENPVVVMGPVSHNGGDPSTVRVKNTSPISFDYQIDEWDYLDGGHTSERIDYIVMEAGSYDLGGLKAEAGVINNVDHNFKTHSFLQNFSEKPVVIAQVVTANGASAVTTRLKNISTSGFEVKAQEEEGNDGTHAQEKIAFIAIEPGYGSLYGQLLEVGRTGNTVTDAWHTINFDNIFSATPRSFVGQIQTYDGGDACTLRKRNLCSSSIEIFCEEEQSSDNETYHTPIRFNC